jgi:purine-binding chemotaxis protein CheW
MGGAATAPPDLGGKYLTFFLDDEEYGLEILKVREIIGLQHITRVPRMPASMLGVINLRGAVIPVVDLRRRFGIGSVKTTDRTCIIVVHAAGVEFGVMVDRVSEVADVSAADVEPAPEFGGDVDTRFLLGLAKSAGGVKLLLDIDRVLSSREMAQLQETADPTALQEAR